MLALPENGHELGMTQCDGGTIFASKPSSSFKDRSGSTHLWSNCVIYIYMIIILDKTHTENCFLAIAEDPACVVCDGTKCFGVTTGNLPPTVF